MSTSSYPHCAITSNLTKSPCPNWMCSVSFLTRHSLLGTSNRVVNEWSCTYRCGISSQLLNMHLHYDIQLPQEHPKSACKNINKCTGRLTKGQNPCTINICTNVSCCHGLQCKSDIKGMFKDHIKVFDWWMRYHNTLTIMMQRLFTFSLLKNKQNILMLGKGNCQNAPCGKHITWNDNLNVNSAIETKHDEWTNRWQKSVCTYMYVVCASWRSPCSHVNKQT